MHKKTKKSVISSMLAYKKKPFEKKYFHLDSNKKYCFRCWINAEKLQFWLRVSNKKDKIYFSRIEEQNIPGQIKVTFQNMETLLTRCIKNDKYEVMCETGDIKIKYEVKIENQIIQKAYLIGLEEIKVDKNNFKFMMQDNRTARREIQHKYETEIHCLKKFCQYIPKNQLFFLKYYDLHSPNCKKFHRDGMDLLPIASQTLDEWVQIPFSCPIVFDEVEKYILQVKDYVVHTVFYKNEKQKLLFGVLNKERTKEINSIYSTQAMYLNVDEKKVPKWGKTESKASNKYLDQIKKGRKIEMVVERKEGKIKWKLFCGKNEEIIEVFWQNLKNQKKQFVPYFQCYNFSNKIRLYPAEYKEQLFSSDQESNSELCELSVEEVWDSDQFSPSPQYECGSDD